MNDWSFDQPCWKKVSNEAKALIKALMEPDLDKRVSVAEALDDAWCAKEASTAELPETLESIKAYVRARKFRKTGLVIIAQEGWRAPSRAPTPTSRRTRREPRRLDAHAPSEWTVDLL